MWLNITLSFDVPKYVVSKLRGIFLQIFVAFSKNLNFSKNADMTSKLRNFNPIVPPLFTYYIHTHTYLWNIFGCFAWTSYVFSWANRHRVHCFCWACSWSLPLRSQIRRTRRRARHLVEWSPDLMPNHCPVCQQMQPVKVNYFKKPIFW